MKKFMLSMAFLMGLGMVNAQNIKFGVKGGLNMSTLAWDSETQKAFDKGVEMAEKLDGSLSKNYRMGFHIGAMAELEINSNIAVQGELVYSTQGVVIEGGGIDGGEKYTAEEVTSLNYLNLPILLKYKLSGIGLELGPQFGFLMSGKAYSYLNDKIDKVGDKDYIDLTEGDYGVGSFDLGLAFGASYTYDNIYAGLRYNLGLMDLAKKHRDGDKSTSKNGVIQLSVGYFF